MEKRQALMASQQRYIEFQEILLEPLKKICNDTLQKAITPESWTEAIITLLPKEDTDLTEINNYRPISLLNVDYKILATIMAD